MGFGYMAVFEILSNKISCLDMSYEEILNFLGEIQPGFGGFKFCFQVPPPLMLFLKFLLYSLFIHLKN